MSDRPLKLIKSPSLMRELNVRLKDFLPMEGGHLMRLPGCSVVISTRLRNALREYSKRHGMTLLERWSDCGRKCMWTHDWVSHTSLTLLAREKPEAYRALAHWAVCSSSPRRVAWQAPSQSGIRDEVRMTFAPATVAGVYCYGLSY